jgi:outer membrane biosynthesis protein TonB
MIQKSPVLAVVAMAATAVVVLLVLRLHHFTEAWLDQRPFPLRAIELDAPPARNGIEYYGKQRMHVLIGADGSVDGVVVMESTLPASFREAAAHAFATARWEPGRKWGLPVAALKVVEVDFAPPTRALEGSLSSPGR